MLPVRPQFVRVGARLSLALLLALAAGRSGATNLSVDYLIIKTPQGNNIIPGACARISPGGLPQHTEQLQMTAYNRGPNGIAQAGLGDDVSVPGIQVSWAVLGANADSIYDAHAGNYSLTDSPGGDYADNRNVSAEITQSFNLVGAASAELKFWHHYTTESGYDYCHVEIKKNNVWTEIASYNGNLGGPGAYSQVSLPLGATFLGNTVKVRFRFTSDSSITMDGWHVDDVQFFINGGQVFSDGFESGTGQWTRQAPWAREVPYVPQVLGTVDANGLFTAGGKTGIAYVIASYLGATSDTIDVKVVPPDWIAGP